MDPDIREDLLKWLDEKIMATQQRHDEVQKTICEWRQATQFKPEEFEEATLQDNTISLGRDQNWDYSFNLTGITPPQPPKWKQVNHLYEDF